MRYLIPDTNIFVQDFRLDGNSFKAFLGNYNAIADRVIIPKIVYQEHLNNFVKRLDGELKKLNDNYINISRLVGEEIKEPEIKKMDALLESYKSHFENKLKSVDYEIVDYPPAPLEVIAKKAIKRLKPFKKSGEGYCDAIIWETILHILRNNKESEVIFLTNNKKDFFDGESIHHELITDLEESEISPSRLKFYRTLKDVVDNLLLAHLDTLDNLREQINTNTVPDVNVEEWLSSQLFDLIAEEAAGRVLSDLTSEDCTIHLSEIYEVLSVKVDEARVLSENNKYITLTAQIGLSIEICADYYQYEDNAYIETLFNHMHAVPTPYDCVTDSGDVEVKVSIVFQGDDLINGKVELISLAGEKGAINYDVPGPYNA